MEQLTFNEIIERITNKLTDSDDDTITSIYNQLFSTPIIYIGDDLWEEEISEDDEIDYNNDDINDDGADDDDLDDVRYNKRKKGKYNQCDFDDYSGYNDDDDEY